MNVEKDVMEDIVGETATKGNMPVFPEGRRGHRQQHWAEAEHYQ